MTTGSEDHLDRIARSVQELVQDHPEFGVLSVYLFGSQAAGRSHGDSDIDLGFLLDRSVHPGERQRFDVRVDLASLLNIPGIPGDVDIVILNDAPPLLARRIVTEGRRLFCADHEEDHAFVRNTQLRAADLIPFLRRTRRTKLERLRS